MTTQPLFTDVRQVCTVVDDFETTVSHLVDQLGIGPFRCWHFRPPRLYGTTFRGRPARYSMKLAITWLDDVQWEVIQPVEGDTLYREHLGAHGRGVQHLLMATGDVPWEAAAAELAAHGHPFAQTAKLNAKVQLGRFTLPSPPNALAGPMSLQFGYVDAERTLRTAIELTRYPLGLSERFSLRAGKAEFCIPPENHHFERPLAHRRVGRVVKITIVTRDLDHTVRSYLDVARVGPWHLFDLGPERLRQVRAAGAPAAFRARVGWSLIGDVLIEVVQPEGASPYEQLLATRGEGVAAVGVLPGREGFAALLHHCRQLGYGSPMEGALLGSHPSAWLESRRWIGTDLELVGAESNLVGLFHNTKPDRVAA